MTAKRALPVLLVAILGFGCATTEQYIRFPNQNVRVEDPSKARIYVTRATLFGAIIPMMIFEDEGTPDEVFVGQTGPDGFLCWERAPGKVTVTGKAENKSHLKFEVAAGMVYYIMQNVQMGILYARNELELVSEEDGREELEDCDPPVLMPHGRD